jgi:hypothetical protein
VCDVTAARGVLRLLGRRASADTGAYK